MYDTPILRHVIKSENLAGVHVLPHILQQQNYAMGLSAQSPRREAINRILLKRTSEPAWRELVVRYLGAEP